MTAISSRNLKIGIIGAGTIVANAHLPVLLNLDGVDVDWIVDADHAKAQAMARAYAGRPVVMPPNAADLPLADIYLLAVPYAARRPYYEALMQRSAAIYVEKPFAKTLPEHEWICASFAANKIADGYQKRSWGPVSFLKDVVASETLGRLKSMRFEAGGPKTSSARYAGDPLAGGGGLLMEIGCHGIDVALFLVAAKELRLDDARMVAENGYDLHTRGKFVIEGAGRSPIDFHLVVSCLRHTANKFVLEFDNATAACSIFTWKGLHVETRSGHRFTLDPADPLQPLSPHQNFFCHWRSFLEALRSGIANHTNAAQSRLTAMALGKLYAADS